MNKFEFNVISQLGRYFFALFVCIFLIACSQNPAPPAATSTPEATDTPVATATPMPTSTPRPVVKYENSVAFDMLHPVEWTHMVISEGLLVFGETQTVQQTLPGASITVFRQSPISVGGDLNEMFQHYMDNGPRATGFDVILDSQPMELGGREALSSEVIREADSGENIDAVRSFIIATQVESGFFYIFTATAPTELWEQHWPDFQIVFNNIVFNE